MFFVVGFVGPLAGAGDGVFFTPIAVGLLGVDVNLARTGGPRGGEDVFCGWVFPGGGLRILGLCGGVCVAGRVSGGSPRPVSGGRWGLWRWGWGFSSRRFFCCWVGGRSGSPRRVDRLAVRLGFVWEWESLMRYSAERTAWGLAALGRRTI